MMHDSQDQPVKNAQTLVITGRKWNDKNAVDDTKSSHKMKRGWCCKNWQCRFPSTTLVINSVHKKEKRNGKRRKRLATTVEQLKQIYGPGVKISKKDIVWYDT